MGVNTSPLERIVDLLEGGVGIGGGGGDPVEVSQVTGEAWNVSQPGLSGGGATTWTAVAATQTAIPATPLVGRATLLVQAHETNALPIFIGFSGLTARVYGAAPGAADGILLLPGKSYPISLAAGVTLYARATATGCYVGVQEVAA